MPTLYDILTEAKAIEADARTLERRAHALVTAIYNLVNNTAPHVFDWPPVVAPTSNTRAEQRVNFAYGNAAADDTTSTKESVEAAADIMKAAHTLPPPGMRWRVLAVPIDD